jgi:hypothetical protein
MKTRKFMKCLPMLRVAFSIMVIFSFWMNVLSYMLAKNYADVGTEYQVAASFEPSAQEETLQGTDGSQREFRGFGTVEQSDTEHFDDFAN